jgi:hypothetical protein
VRTLAAGSAGLDCITSPYRIVVGATRDDAGCRLDAGRARPAKHPS